MALFKGFRRGIVRLAANTVRPCGIRIDGFGRELVLRLGDALWPFPKSSLENEFRLEPHSLEKNKPNAELVLDLSHANERLLVYAFRTMYATYRRTPLGRLIRKTFAEHPGGTFLDIGANLGIYSLIAHAAGARTVLFEPEPHHAAFLQRNPAVFQRVYDCALSNRDGNAILNVAIDSKPGISSLAGQATDSIYATTTEVGLQSLDSILAANPTDPLWTTIPLIKIDVEGHEVETVEGMQGFLAGGRCRYIWCEVRGPRSRRATDSCSKVNEIMAHAGYRPFWTNHRRPQPFAGAKRLPQVFDLLYMRP